MTQSQIARRLGLSQSAVSRLLAHAKPYLEKQSSFRFRHEMVDGTTMNLILQQASTHELAPLLDEFAKECGCRKGPALRVIQVPETARANDRMRRFTAFTTEAAPYIRSLLGRDSVETCGVTWGFMLWDLAMGLRAMGIPGPWRSKRPIRFIPLTGDPLQDRKLYPPSLTSSNISAEMSKIANADEYRPPWLGLVPAYIPDQFQGKQVKTIERLIHLVPEYEEIFGAKGRRGLAFELDAILTSVGPASKPLGFGMGRLFASLGKRVSQLSGQIYGDIGGVLLPRDPERPSVLVRGIERRWKGLGREHLQSCALRAIADDPATGRPGVIVLAVGEARAEVVLRAIERGLINQLIIDQNLERALDALLTARRARPAEETKVR
jgi:predicted transcriptional regulator